MSVGKRVGLPLQPSPSYRGKCQWIEGDPVGDPTDKIKCMKPTVYNEHNKLTSWCKEHHEIVWRPVIRKI